MRDGGYAIIPMDEYMRISAEAKKSSKQVALIKDRTMEMLGALSEETRGAVFAELESAGYSVFVEKIQKLGRGWR